jgi:CBS domain-containing protein
MPYLDSVRPTHCPTAATSLCELRWRKEQDAAMNVQQIMSSPAVTLEPSTTLRDAAMRMFDHHVAAMPVVEAGRLIGIVGEADLYRALAATHGVPLGGTVPFDALGRPEVASDIMRRGVLWVKASDNASLAAQLLMRHARSLPVLDHGQVVGMVSRRDVIGPLLDGTPTQIHPPYIPQTRNPQTAEAQSECGRNAARVDTGKVR